MTILNEDVIKDIFISSANAELLSADDHKLFENTLPALFHEYEGSAVGQDLEDIIALVLNYRTARKDKKDTLDVSSFFRGMACCTHTKKSISEKEHTLRKKLSEAMDLMGGGLIGNDIARELKSSIEKALADDLGAYLYHPAPIETPAVNIDAIRNFLSKITKNKKAKNALLQNL